MEQYELQGSSPDLWSKASMLAFTSLNPTSLSWALSLQEALLGLGKEYSKGAW